MIRLLPASYKRAWDPGPATEIATRTLRKYLLNGHENDHLASCGQLRREVDLNWTRPAKVAAWRRWTLTRFLKDGWDWEM